MGMLAAAKDLRAVIHSQDRREWLADSPGKGELFETKALIIGYGQIGGAFLDVTDPEPAPPDDPIWSTRNVMVTSHVSGRAQTRTTERVAAPSSSKTWLVTANHGPSPTRWISSTVIDA